ncbi:MAG TPA: ATP-binding protein, partial [Pirellulaceae bacterium]|nr:ATP-binding protein [Pirellulaceae bacterium]
MNPTSRPDEDNLGHRAGAFLSGHDGDQELDDRFREIFSAQQHQLHSQVDRTFFGLMVLQWIAAVAASIWLTPWTWDGASASIHPHVTLAAFGGGALVIMTCLMVWLRPGTVLTRHVVAISQVAFSTLFIHISGGRIEAHFHVFGSLAFLAAYRDWRVLISATVFVAADHLFRGIWWPQSVFGVATAEPWRWLEHAAWVLFEDTFLILNIRRSVAEMQRVAHQTARLEQQNQALTAVVAKERAVVEGALDAIVEIDQHGCITGWNPQAETTFGWKASEVMGQLLSEYIIPPEYRQAHMHGLRRFVETGRAYALNQRLDLEAIDRTGRRFPIEIAITSARQGEQIVFCAFVRDISERRQYEQDLKQAVEAANLANRAKSEFLANMSHEIRTPLNAILGFADLMDADDITSGDAKSYLHTIQASGRHLLTLINDVLDLSKVESGKLDIEISHCSPEKVVEEVVSMLRVRALEKGLTLEARWTTPCPASITTDPLRLRQAIMNLTNNAIRFTDQGGVTVLVGVTEDAGRPQLAVEVQDTGIGIQAGELERIFQPFVQVDSSTTRRVGGTGLGLAISRNIARQLGGEITVSSELGRGTRFRLTIDTGLDQMDAEPMGECDQFTQDQDSEPGDAEETPVPRHNKLNQTRVLVVEDVEVNRRLLLLVLGKAGAIADWVENGKQAIDQVDKQRYDVILMDMQMPIMDGYTATQHLREMGCATPIIALTAHAMRCDETKCLQAGCDRYLTKPINARLLI